MRRGKKGRVADRVVEDPRSSSLAMMRTCLRPRSSTTEIEYTTMSLRESSSRTTNPRDPRSGWRKIAAFAFTSPIFALAPATCTHTDCPGLATQREISLTSWARMKS